VKPQEINQFNIPVELKKRLTDVQYFTEIDSTNTEAMRQLDSGKTGNFLLLAHAQSAGKGRRGRIWQSPAGAGIYLTLVRPFARDIKELQALSLVTALSVQEALALSAVSGIQLKWPNDLLVNKRKLAGILLELKQCNGVNYVVFGVGINLNLPNAVREAIDQPVTDLMSLSQAIPDKSLLVTIVVETLLNNLLEFEKTAFASFQSRWNALDCYRHLDIVLQIGDVQKIGRSMGVNESGALLLQTASGLEVIRGGEVFPSLLAAVRSSESGCAV